MTGSLENGVPGLLAPQHRGQQEGGLAITVWPSCCLHRVLRKVLLEETVLEALQILSTSFCSTSTCRYSVLSSLE